MLKNPLIGSIAFFLILTGCEFLTVCGFLFLRLKNVWLNMEFPLACISTSWPLFEGIEACLTLGLLSMEELIELTGEKTLGFSFGISPPKTINYFWLIGWNIGMSVSSKSASLIRFSVLSSLRSSYETSILIYKGLSSGGGVCYIIYYPELVPVTTDY